MSDGIKFLCIKPLKPSSTCGFVNQDIDWNVMPAGATPRLWLLTESLGGLRWNFKANKSPLEKCIATLFGLSVHGLAVFPGRDESSFSERWQGGTSRHNENLKNLRDVDTAGKAWW